MTSSVMEPEETIELSTRKIISVLIGVIAAMFLSVLDQTVVGAALPTIVGDLKGVGDQQWVTTVYILLSAIILPICGKLGDRLGHKTLDRLDQVQQREQRRPRVRVLGDDRVGPGLGQFVEDDIGAQKDGHTDSPVRVTQR